MHHTLSLPPPHEEEPVSIDGIPLLTLCHQLPRLSGDGRFNRYYDACRESFLAACRRELLTELRSTLAGRAAEQVVFGVKTTGAANDIQKATSLARNMITQYGMSEAFGLMGLATVEHQYLEGQAYMDCSNETAGKVDVEVQQLLQACYEDAVRILTEHRPLLDEVASYLLVKETITGDELMAYVNAEAPAKEE